MKYKVLKSNLQGKVNIPSSKSIAARYLFTSIFSKEQISFSGYGFSEDIKTYFENVQKIKPDSYCKLNEDGSFFIYVDNVVDNELYYKNKDKVKVFDCKDSGFCLRALPIILSYFPSSNLIKASDQLLNRPYKMVLKTIKEGKAKCIYFKNDKYFMVKGPIQPSKYILSTKITTQHVSGLLMTLPFIEGKSYVFVKTYNNSSFIDLTVNILNKAGISIEKIENKKLKKVDYDKNYKNEIYYIDGNQNVNFNNILNLNNKQNIKQNNNININQNVILIESDWSSASFFLVSAALGGPIEFSNLQINSLQPDSKIIDILKLVGAEIKIDKENNIITVKRNNLHSFEFDISDCPDLFPSIAVLASFCEGETKIYGIERLKYKESNRIKSIYENFNKIGVKIKIKKDFVLIEGKNDFENSVSDEILVFSYNDHRIFMALFILATYSKCNIIIDDNDSFKKSYPEFLIHYKTLGGDFEFY
ncbi:MAG TPA: hypothetical protein PLF21_05635 [Exilispira sp.]|nr:hypothetical protein [Exilispira sp.]